jgi:hypothetical protein
MESLDNSTHNVEQIQKAKKEIIQMLNDNYDVFSQIVNCFENDPGRYMCTKESGEIVVKLFLERGGTSFQIIDISEIGVSEQIAYVLNDLGFEGIGEEYDDIIFTKITVVYPGGTYSQGLFCNKNDAGIDKIQEYSGIFGERVLIKDQWFYYYSRMWEDVISAKPNR